MKKVFFLTCFVIAIISLQAQDTIVTKEKRNNAHHIGAYFGASSGYGISYRYFPKDIGFQITTTPLLGSDQINLSIGGMFLVSLHRTKMTNIFGYVSTHYNYSMYESGEKGTNSYYKSEDKLSVTGIGVGFELNIADRVGFNWHLGYAYFSDSYSYTGSEPESDWRTFIDGGTGIFYKF